MTEVRRQNLVIAISLSTLITALGTAFMIGVKSSQFEARIQASVTAHEMYLWERRTESLNPGWKAAGIIELHQRMNGSWNANKGE
jgi:hypothetical protein